MTEIIGTDVTNAGMTLSQMKTALKRYGFDDADPLAIWLNAAMHDLESSFDWPFLEELITITAVATQNTLVFPVDFFKIITVKDLTNRHKVTYYDRHRFSRDIQDPTEIGYPEIYTLIGTDTLQFWRVLQFPVTFEVEYQGLIPDMVNDGDYPGGTVLIVPALCHYPIIQRAASIALQAENEEDRAKTAEEQYQRSLMKLMAKFGERELDEPTTVQDTQGYGTAHSRMHI